VPGPETCPIRDKRGGFTLAKIDSDAAPHAERSPGGNRVTATTTVSRLQIAVVPFDSVLAPGLTNPAACAGRIHDSRSLWQGNLLADLLASLASLSLRRLKLKGSIGAETVLVNAAATALRALAADSGNSTGRRNHRPFSREVGVRPTTIPCPWGRGGLFGGGSNVRFPGMV